MVSIDGNIAGVLALLLSLLLAPPICMFMTGFLTRKNNAKLARKLFIVGVIYLLFGIVIYGYFFLKLFVW